MYGYTMRVAQPIDAYRALHQAVMDIVGDDLEGLILHYAHPSDQGFVLTEVWERKDQLDAFNRDVLPRAMQQVGAPTDGPQPEILEFEPVVVITPRAHRSDSQR